MNLNDPLHQRSLINGSKLLIASSSQRLCCLGGAPSTTGASELNEAVQTHPLNHSTRQYSAS